MLIFLVIGYCLLVVGCCLHSRLLFYALDRQKILSGLKTNFWCPALKIHRSYWQCKGTKFSARLQIFPFNLGRFSARIWHFVHVTLSFRNNIPRVTKITFGVFKFLFGVIVNTSGETISTYNIGCQSPVPVASEFKRLGAWNMSVPVFHRERFPPFSCFFRK